MALKTQRQTVLTIAQALKLLPLLEALGPDVAHLTPKQLLSVAGIPGRWPYGPKARKLRKELDSYATILQAKVVSRTINNQVYTSAEIHVIPFVELILASKLLELLAESEHSYPAYFRACQSVYGITPESSMTELLTLLRWAPLVFEAAKATWPSVWDSPSKGGQPDPYLAKFGWLAHIAALGCFDHSYDPDLEARIYQTETHRIMAELIRRRDKAAHLASPKPS